jgi:hypothetical protein
MGYKNSDNSPQAKENKIYLYAQHVNDGYYQVFIKNISHEADFFDIAYGRYLPQDDKKPFFVDSHGIISPFRKDLKIYLTEFNKNDPVFRRNFFIDLKLRKPTRTIAMLEAIVPPKNKLLNTIGAEIEIELKPRKDLKAIGELLEGIRPNIKERYRFLLKEISNTREFMTKNNLPEGPAIRPYMNELLQLNELAGLYNQGVLIKNVGGQHSIKYGWFIQDFGLAEPNGTAPKVKVVIDLGLPAEE